MRGRTVSSIPQPSEVPSTPPSAAHERIGEFDALRGMAIICVMYLHAYFGPWLTMPHREWLFLNASLLVANSAVPVFLFMSGFLSARDRSTSFSMLIESRLRRVAVPLALWMLVALLWNIWVGGGLTIEMIGSFAMFNIAGQFYYVLVLLMLTAACYPLRHVDDHRLRQIVIAAFFANAAMILFYQTHPLEGLLWSLAYRNPLVWVFSFTFGLYIGRVRGHVRFSPAIVAAAAVAMLLDAAAYMYLGERDGYPDSYFGVTVFLFAVCGFVVYPAALRSLDRTRIGHLLLAPFVALAPFAFGIYLVHKPYFVGKLSDYVVSGSFVSDDYLELLGSLLLVGGTAAIAFVVITNRLFPRFSAVMLGVDAPRRVVEADTRA